MKDVLCTYMIEGEEEENGKEKKTLILLGIIVENG
jgi:hypothetical protein